MEVIAQTMEVIAQTMEVIAQKVHAPKYISESYSDFKKC